jgi:hypothetical protein
MDRVLSTDKISEVKLKINRIQEDYAGVGLGIVHKEVVEK